MIPPEPDPPLLRVADLKTPHVGPLSFVLRQGEVLGVRGESGAGKTVLLRALADLTTWEGEMWLRGVPCAGIHPTLWRRSVAWSPAEPRWWHDIVGAHFSTPPDAALLDSLGLSTELLDRPANGLSEGQKQRLGLLRTLSLEPQVLLLDEPTARLDVANARRVESVLLEYVARSGAAAVWVSHDADQLSRVAARILILRRGRLVENHQESES